VAVVLGLLMMINVLVSINLASTYERL